MVTPINLQLAHWNVEHTAQQIRDPSAAAHQAGQQGQAAAEAIRKDSSVQGAEESAEEEPIGARRKKEESEGEGKKGRGQRKDSSPQGEEKDGGSSTSMAEEGRLDFYA